MNGLSDPERVLDDMGGNDFEVVIATINKIRLGTVDYVIYIHIYILL